MSKAKPLKQLSMGTSRRRFPPLKACSDCSGENRWRSKGGWVPPASSADALWLHCAACGTWDFTCSYFCHHLSVIPRDRLRNRHGLPSHDSCPHAYEYAQMLTHFGKRKKILHLSILMTKIKPHSWIAFSIPVASTSST